MTLVYGKGVKSPVDSLPPAVKSARFDEGLVKLSGLIPDFNKALSSFYINGVAPRYRGG